MVPKPRNIVLGVGAVGVAGLTAASIGKDRITQAASHIPQIPGRISNFARGLTHDASRYEAYASDSETDATATEAPTLYKREGDQVEGIAREPESLIIEPLEPAAPTARGLGTAPISER